LASDVFLLPSREDPFPLVCLEAADCGLPVICFADAGGMPDFVGNERGATVPYLDVEHMAAELVSLLRDDARRRLCAERASQKVRANFDVSVKGREIYELVQSLCSKSLPSGTPTPRSEKAKRATGISPVQIPQ